MNSNNFLQFKLTSSTILALNMVVVEVLFLPTLQGVSELALAMKEKTSQLKTRRDEATNPMNPIAHESHEPLDQLGGSAVLDQT